MISSPGIGPQIGLQIGPQRPHYCSLNSPQLREQTVMEKVKGTVMQEMEKVKGTGTVMQKMEKVKGTVMQKMEADIGSKETPQKRASPTC